MYLSLSVLQLRLLLLHPLHEHLPHLVFSLLQLHQELLPLGLVGLLQAAHTHTNTQSVVSGSFVCTVSPQVFVNSPDGFALWVGILESHFFKFAASVQLVMSSVCLLPQVLHVDADEHLPQLHKVTVTLILH